MAEDDHHPTAGQRVDQTAHTVRIVVALLLVVGVVALAIANTDDTSVDYLVGDTDAPLFVVVIGAAVAGAVIAALLRRRHHHHA